MLNSPAYSAVVKLSLAVGYFNGISKSLNDNVERSGEVYNGD